MNIKKIGWQKYEDMLEKQMASPLFDVILGRELELELEEEYNSELSQNPEISDSNTVHLDSSIIESIALTTGFDCWIGHTNFNLTPRIKDILNTVDGIEVLKICSRYRFFIGIGKMFNIKDVRYLIEQELEINQGEEIEKY